ncbi:MAG: hypothetical protein IPL78_31450 [Chloroflexi bacterium]|nr:hypothetical protein [Chloroflexota bacterium]
MPQKETHPIYNHEYCAWLLRVWFEQGHGWRVSIQHVQTRERFGFNDLAAAMNFIEQHLSLSITPQL